MNTKAAHTLASLALLAGCELSHGGESNTSGSNWLRCKKLSECNAIEAVACSADGYCTDQDGERIAALSKPAGGDAGLDRSPTDSGCAWGVSEALAKIGVSAPDRDNCGPFKYQYGAYSFMDMIAARGCFERGQQNGGRGVEFSLNRCIDCDAPTHYVATPTGKLYGVQFDPSNFGGDGVRKVRLESCSAVTLNESMTDFECSAPSLLYSCDEPNVVVRGAPSHQPIKPYKLSDPPSLPGLTKVKLHVYVSNQSFEVPLVYVRVELDDVMAIQGDFAVEGQHTWLEFELELTPGTHNLSVYGRRFTDTDGKTAANLSRTISVPAERWIVLSYWSADQTEDPSITLTESDQPVAFD